MPKSLIEALSGNALPRPPIWFMRQAGRYLPEYRALRQQAKNFMELCGTPALAAEATLQPIRRFGFDAAIIFSDILVIPAALGRDVQFIEGDGPRHPPILDPNEIESLFGDADERFLKPTCEALALVKVELSAETSLIGFCGAPWTVATYMIAGKSSPDQAVTRRFAYSHPDAFKMLLDRIADVSAGYLCRQIDAGADAVQIFDSWCGVLPEAEFQRWCIAPVKQIVDQVRSKHPSAKIIVFPRDAAPKRLAEAQANWRCDGLSISSAGSLTEMDAALPGNIALQGNLDPLLLASGGPALLKAVDEIVSLSRKRPLIFNLGHGILPDTPIAHVEAVLKRIRA